MNPTTATIELPESRLTSIKALETSNSNAEINIEIGLSKKLF
ncbi:hypothetical protein JCM19236_3934 [Vibrio sp. JCM 19236]|nr:hypothetical protein JCM19236_3934 [Vibrio sp. JCM 19236]